MFESAQAQQTPFVHFYATNSDFHLCAYQRRLKNLISIFHGEVR